MKWFGESWGAPCCEPDDQADTPVGTACLHCTEPIQAGEQGFVQEDGVAFHRACFLRGVVGSVAHLERRCGCFVAGSAAGDPPGLTRRQAAEAAVALWAKMLEKQ